MASARSSTPSINANLPRIWEELAKRASTETDPNKLADTIKQLCEAFELRDPAASRV